MIIYKNTNAIELNVATAAVVMTPDSPMNQQF